MAKNIVAYVGVSAFDIILYLSRILIKLDRRVLLVDNSETKALTCSFPQIQGVNTNIGCITYRSVDFTTQTVTYELSEQYDDVLIDFGFHQTKMDISLLTRVIYVVDILENNIFKMASMENFSDTVGKALFIRDMIDTRISIDHIISTVNKGISKSNTYLVPRDDGDYYNSFLCQLSKVPRFTHISHRMREVLFFEIKKLYREISERQLKMVYHKARRGE